MVSRFVHTSSVAISGDLGFTPANEQTPPHPQSIYGETKLAGEQAGNWTSAAVRQLDVVVLRPSWVVRPGLCPHGQDHSRVGELGASSWSDRATTSDIRSISADMIDAFRRAAVTKYGVGEILLVAGEHAVTTRELIESICAAFDLPRPLYASRILPRVPLAHCAEAVCSFMDREPTCLTTDARVLRHKQLVRHVTSPHSPRVCTA